jgi:exosortase A-associated hydrolase 2
VVLPEALFLPLRRGRRFCIRYVPPDASRSRGTMLYVHPFAEEMNKSRRMAALQARALAQAGWTVLQLDLFGCGDSDGDFADASWDQWVSDIVETSAWLDRQGRPASCLWGLRVGCLLALQAAERIAPAPDLLLWQPALSGRQSLQQFLRLKVAGQILGEAAAADRLGVQQLRERISAGETLEVAGYMLSPGLALGLDAAELRPLAAQTRVAWLEVTASATTEVSPAASARIDAWRAAGHRVDTSVVVGPAFWQTQAISECAALVETTLAAVEGWKT